MSHTLFSFYIATSASSTSGGYKLNLGATGVAGDSLFTFLANPKAFNDAVTHAGIKLNTHGLYHSDQISIVETLAHDLTNWMKQIEFVDDDYSAPYLYGKCSSATDCAGMTLEISYGYHAHDGLDVLMDARVSDVLKFYVVKNVSIPDRIPGTTADNLRMIAGQWADNLRIQSIGLTNEDNQIRRKGFTSTGEYSKVWLNPGKPFNGYTEVISDFYFPN
jgi:hypothetical protein